MLIGRLIVINASLLAISRNGLECNTRSPGEPFAASVLRIQSNDQVTAAISFDRLFN